MLQIQIKKIEGEFHEKVQIRLGKLKELNASSESSKVSFCILFSINMLSRPHIHGLPMRTTFK